MGRSGFLTLAALFALSAVVALSVHIYSQPLTLRLAVGPIGSDDVRMAAAFVQTLNREKSAVRIRLVMTQGLADSAQQLEEGRAELAIVRPDIKLPSRAETILIMRRFFPFFATSRESRIERVADLRGRRVGVVSNPTGNVDLLKTVLAYYEVPYNEVEIVGLTAQDIAPAAMQGRIDAMFAVGALSARTLSQGIATTRQAWGADPVFIPIREADALGVRNRAIEPGEIVRGAFGGDPPKPSEPLTTISVTHRLVTTASVADDAISELTRMILTQRAALSMEVPAIQGIEAPSTARDAVLPVHAGASAYLDGNEKTFFERYGDWFYLGVMAMSLLGSAAAALLSRASGVRRRNAMEGLTRIIAMIAQVRETEDLARIEAIEREADAILAQTLDRVAQHALDEAGLSAYRLAMDQLGRAIAAKRRELEQDEDALQVT